MDRNLPAGAQAPQADQPSAPGRAVRISSPASILAIVPHLLGFLPRRSLVVIGAGPPRDHINVTLRYDLPDPPDRAAAGETAAHALSVLASQRQTVAVVIGYGPGSLVTPIADVMRGEVPRAGLDLRDLLRVEDGRYWSYLCRDPSCCPPQGLPLDLRHPAAGALATAGSLVLPDRDALAATIAPLSGTAARSLRDATRRAEARAASMLTRLAVLEGLRAVAGAIAAYRSGGSFTGDDQVAWLSVLLTSLRVRDDAWARMDPAHRDAHRRLWTDVARRASQRYVPAPASLLAFTAWQCGNGALANMALDRALDADPGYSMALLLRDAIGAGVPPSMAVLPMSPEEVAASYDATGDAGDGGAGWDAGSAWGGR